jgi:UDP-N-acetyl-2-amino-2-deoxyglucuronate dehydrogenase
MEKIKKFALIGAAGYIAPRHLKAIKDTGNNLLAAYDPNDSVGIIDSYFPNASFYTEFERFDRSVEKMRRIGSPIDYVSICSPNYLHDAHIRFGLRNMANVICEKPLVLNSWNVDSLIQTENETGKNVFTILQLRLHPVLIELKNKIDNTKTDKKYELDLTYITSRGNWYYTSWKGDINKSGGIATNIGIHFFDMLIWLFGDVIENKVHLNTHDRASGFIEFKNARVRWFLSINSATLPEDIIKLGKTTYRSITIDGEPIEFSDGFTDLHNKSYIEILNGNGFTLKEARPAVALAHEIREIKSIGLVGDYHPFSKLDLTEHPFKIRK